MAPAILDRFNSRVIIILTIIFLHITIQCAYAEQNSENSLPEIFKPGNINTGKFTLEKFSIPGHGQLALQVPVNWEYTYILSADDQPPIITFYALDGEGRELFQLNLSSLWDDGYKRNITDPIQVKNFVEDIGNELLKSSREAKLTLNSFTGENGFGYFFNLSDAIVRQEGYPYLMQGAYAMDDILLVYSLFTYEKNSSIHSEILDMLSTAKQIFQKTVQNFNVLNLDKLNTISLLHEFP